MSVFICCFCIVSAIVLFVWSSAIALVKGIQQVRCLHQIPCADCDFFTNNYRLKCTVRPCVACTEDAIGCTDFEPKTYFANSCQQHCSRYHKSDAVISAVPSLAMAAKSPPVTALVITNEAKQSHSSEPGDLLVAIPLAMTYTNDAPKHDVRS